MGKLNGDGNDGAGLVDRMLPCPYKHPSAFPASNAAREAGNEDEAQRIIKAVKTGEPWQGVKPKPAVRIVEAAKVEQEPSGDTPDDKSRKDYYREYKRQKRAADKATPSGS